MKMFYKKGRSSIVLMLVLAMLLQIVGPVVGDFVYAMGEEEGFKVTQESPVEDGNVTIDWEFILDPNNSKDFYEYNSNFTLKEGKEPQALTGEDENGNKVEIGIYKISEDGKITVDIHKELYEVFEEVVEPEEEEIVPLTPLIPAEPVEQEETTTETEQEQIEENNEKSTESEETNKTMGRILRMVASTSDIDGLISQDEVNEGVKPLKFRGSFDVEGVVEKEDKSLFARLTLFSAGGKDLGDIFTVDKIWKDRVNGIGGTEIIENTPVDLDKNTTITMKYNWSVQGKDARAGNTASIKIPDIFNSAGTFPNADITLTDGKKVGEWTISGGFLRFTFDKGIEGVGQDDLQDTFVEFGFKLNMTKFEQDVKHKIDFKDSMNKTFDLVTKPNITNAKSISKVGVANGTEAGGKKDAKAITWTIDVLNTTSDKLENVTLTDTTPEGLSLKTDSFKKTELTMGINGSKYTKGNSTSVSDPSSGTGFSIDLGGIEPYSGYRIEYTTDITDFTKTTFTNTATIDKGTAPLTASTTVGELTRSAPLEKNGEVLNPETYADEIKWTIDVNKGGISIAIPKIEDRLPTGLSIKKVDGVDQIFVYKDNILVTTGVNTSVSGQKLTITLPAITKDDIYRIEYTTVVDYTEVEGGKYQKENIFTNSALLYDGESKIGDTAVTKDITTTRKHLLYKDGSNPSPYGDTLSWTIKVNQAYHSITNAVLHDTIPANLEFDPDNVVIKKKVKGTSNFVKLEGSDRPIVTELDVNRKATINLGNIIDEYEITYTTKITDAGFTENASFKNNAYLTYGNSGTGIGSGVEDHPVDKTLTPTNNSYTKTSTNIDYDNKTISWKIEIDPIKDPITELNIVDTFPNKGMIFLTNEVEPNSFKITKGSTDITNETDIYTLSPNGADPDKGYHKGFTISFTKGTNDAPILSKEKMTITYKTSFDPQRVVEGKRLESYTGTDAIEYKNEAVLTMKTKSGKTPTKTLTEKVLDKSETDSPAWNSGKKEGRRVYLEGGILTDGWVSGKDRFIEWKIYTNYLNQDLGTGVIVTDTIGYEGEIDLNSVEIKGYTVSSSSGGTTDGSIANVNCTKTLSEDKKTLTITFNEKVDKRYVIIYHTTVPQKSQATYTNGANVKVGDTNYPYNGSVSYDKNDSYITKSSSVTGTKAYTDDEIDWNIVINESLSTNMENVVIEDTIAKGMAYKKDSMKVYRIEGSTEVEVEVEEGASKDYTLDVVGDQNQATGTKMTITFNNPINHKYVIKYKTIVTATTGNVKNSAEVKGSHIKTEKKSGKLYTAEKFGFTGGVIASRGSIKIVKTDDKTPSIKLSGAKFKVYYLLNGVEQIVTNASGKDTHTTNNSGEISLTSLVLGREYFIREVEAPSGYVMNDDGEVSKTLTSEIGEKDIELTFTNTKLEDAKGSIKFTKKGEGGDLLGGAEFTLYKKSDNSVVKTATSDENGIVKFEDVSNGNYIIKETNPPEGYVLNTTLIEIEIDIKKNGETIELDYIVNEIVKGNIKFTKYGKYLDEDKKPLVGAEFMIYKAPYNEGDDPVVPAVKSNLEGIVELKNIPYGKYVIVENNAPNGYLKSTAQIPVTIEKDEFTVELTEEDEYKLINTRIDADIQVKKFGEGDNPPALKGAKFELLQGDDVKYESKTAEDGTEIFKNVEFGTYKLRESKAPEGYNLSDKTYTVVVEEHRDETLVFEYFNTKIRGNIKLKKVGEDGEGLENAEFSIYKSTDTEFKVPISTVKSNLDGEILFENVAYGEYKIKETKAPEGYNLSDKVLEAKITTQDEVVDLTTNPVSNTKIRGNIEILKRNRNTHNPLKGATIGLYSVIDMLIDEKISGDDGRVVFENLEYGSYYFKETKAPSGYILDNTKYYFDIENNNVMLERNLDNRKIPSDPYYPPTGGGGGGGGPTDPTNPPTDPKPPVNPPTDPNPPVDPPVEIQEIPKEPNDPTIKEETPKDTPKEGEIEVPEDSEPKITTPPANGTVTIDPNGKWTYTPNPGFVGKDNFTITITHPDGTEEEIFVEIDVDEPPLGNIEAGGSTTQESVKTLPKTGSIGRLGFYISGLLFMILGIFIVRRKTE